MAAAGVKLASTVAGAMAQDNNADANKLSALYSQKNEVNAVNAREMQVGDAASQQLRLAQRKTTTALSSASLSATEAGVSGNSVDALLNDIKGEDSLFSQNVKLNAENEKAQLERQKLGIYATTDSRINNAPRANPFAVGLRLGGDALSAYDQAQSRLPPSDKP